MTFKCAFVFVGFISCCYGLKKFRCIKGITVNFISKKLCQLADDMTLFLSNNGSVSCVLQIFEEFYRYAGLKLNKSKTEATILHSDHNLELNIRIGKILAF